MTNVVDGDTVDVSLVGIGVIRVRVLGIDSPEVQGMVQCGGPDASAFATRTLLGKPVELRGDPSQPELDSYGRSLRYVVQAGMNYSETIADQGFGPPRRP